MNNREMRRVLCEAGVIKRGVYVQPIPPWVAALVDRLTQKEAVRLVVAEVAAEDPSVDPVALARALAEVAAQDPEGVRRFVMDNPRGKLRVGAFMAARRRIAKAVQEAAPPDALGPMGFVARALGISRERLIGWLEREPAVRRVA